MYLPEAGHGADLNLIYASAFKEFVGFFETQPVNGFFVIRHGIVWKLVSEATKLRNCSGKSASDGKESLQIRQEAIIPKVTSGYQRLIR